MSFFMKDLFQSIFLPNDDGSLPPAVGAHTERDKKVLHSLFTFCLLAAVSFTSCSFAYLGFARVADKMALKLRRSFFEQLLKKDCAMYDSHSSAEMATRLTNDTYDFRQGLGEKLAQLIVGLVMSPMGFVVAFTQDWRLTLMMLGAIPFMAGGIGMAMRTMSTSAARQQESYAKAGGLAEAALSGILFVAAFNGFSREAARYDQQLANAERNGARAGWCNGLSMGSSILVIYSTFALGFYAGSLLVVRDYDNNCWVSDPPFGWCFTGATMLSTLFAVLQGGIGISQAAMPMVTLTAARAAAARIYAVLDEPPAFDAEAGACPESAEGRVDFKDVTFFYPSRLEKPALDHVSLAIPAGKTAAFIGPSGSGKSTIIALLQRFYDAGSGAVLFDGRDIRGLNLHWLRSKMALVQQEPILFAGTVLENISYGRKGGASEQQCLEAAQAANAKDFVTSFPAGFQTQVGERGMQLSGGQKQRIAIARAMVREPAVLLLDEATSALDTVSERVVQEALDKLMAQKARTTLVIAHRLSTVRDADKIFVLENGHLLEEGSHSELMSKPGSLYAQLVQLQEITGAEETTSLIRQVSSGSTSSLEKDSAPTRQLSPVCLDGISGISLVEHDAGLSRVADHGDILETLDEDDAGVPVPMARLWQLQRQDWAYVFMGLLATIPLGAGRPLMGRLFSAASNSFSRPPAIRIGEGPYAQWIGILDTQDLRHEADKQCLQFFLLGAMMCVSTAIQLGCFRKAAESLTRQVRLMSFRAMLRQDISWFDARSAGQLADRLASEAPLIKSFTGENLAGVLQVIITVITGLGLALAASWQLTLCTAIFLPMLTLGSLAMLQALKQTNQTRAGPVVSEAMGNIRTVAAFSLEERMLQRYQELLQMEAQGEWNSSKATGLGAAFNSSITYVMFGGVIFVANIFISNGEINPASVLEVLFPIMFAAQGAAMASQWQSDKAKARLAVNHLFQTLDRTPSIDAYSEAGRQPEQVCGAIEFRNVSFRYPSRPDVVVFDDFCLAIEPSTTVALCGPSGSGKSTTIALLQRFYDPRAGSVHLDGQDLRDLNLAWLRGKMALVQQEPILFVGTVLENISYGREGGASEQQCVEAAVAANAKGFIASFPEGFQTQVGERGMQLSGGQKQRIAIARAMVREPAVLLLDEATSALDSESERVVQEALDKLMAQKARTTLVIAHRLSTITGSDLICVVYQGRIVEKGTHNELICIPGSHYQQLAKRQHLGPA
ncbi:unnamed protein product [Polarella glacialis]|uniref:Bile salt export pump n=1 Tax=Polarella glacialis TaxID=89957 RepID=A0A813D298_POLGL|nr:unnamed protein product [Polarella glacialis]